MQQEVEFIKLSATQNMTILIKTNHPLKDYPKIAAKIMSYDSVHAEQVGFIEKSTNDQATAKLFMAGEEFCGNACMALACLIASEQQAEANVVLESSGIDDLVLCNVQKNIDRYECQVKMPIPQKIWQSTIDYEGIGRDIVFIRYDSYLHIILKVRSFSNHLKERIQDLARLLGKALDERLIGILLYREESNELAPLIYVPALESMVWERGCGSGTASIGIYLAWKKKREIMEKIKQPGGTIQVSANYTEKSKHVQIKGIVDIVARGRAYIKL